MEFCYRRQQGNVLLSKPETPGAAAQGAKVRDCALSAKHCNTSSPREVSSADFLKEKVNTVQKKQAEDSMC